jgi:aminoglycoside 3-N-acetyltransferase I
MDVDLKIKRLTKKDILLFKRLIQLFEEVFEDGKVEKVKKSYLKSLLADEAFVAYVAIVDDKVAGAVAAFELPMYYYRGSEMFIYDIAVKPEFQRKGIGKKLLKALILYCKKKNIREIFVAADEEDAHALKFYQSTGGKAGKVVHFNFRTK